MSRSKRVVVSVITDLISDQRVHKICTYLCKKGFLVTLIGRELKQSQPIEEREYKTERIYCFFSKGIMQYAEFNFKLLIKLAFKKADLFLSNDLDTLFPNYLHARIRNKKLVYDSHEYFTGTPELQLKPIKRSIWKALEKFLLPKTNFAYTVNQSISDLYKKEYGVEMSVVRNLPSVKRENKLLCQQLLPLGKFVLLLQGAGINKDRGAEELIEAMQLLPNQFLLVLIGSGDAWCDLKEKSHQLKLLEKVMFIEKIPFLQLAQYTRQAHLGLSLDKPNCINHQLSLPNKVFDYIHAGIPVLASDVVEVKKIIDIYNVGVCINEVTPNKIKDAVLWIYNNQQLYNEWRANTVTASKDLYWENEIQVLDSYFDLA